MPSAEYELKRIADAMESIADSLIKIANPMYLVTNERQVINNRPTRHEVKIPPKNGKYMSTARRGSAAGSR